LLEKFKKSDVFALNVILDDRTVEEALKRIEQLEFSDNSVTVIERLGNDRGKTTFKFLNALAEVEEIVIEFAALNVHNVVGHGHELFDNNIELVKDLRETLAHGSAFSVTDFDFAQLLELLDGSCQVHDVHASFREGIKTHEKSVGGDLPLVLGLGLVVKVSVLVLGADF
jgi:hypothetical protein